MAALPPGYPPFNQRGGTPADDDRSRMTDFAHRQPAGEGGGRVRTSPQERRGGDQRTSPQERRDARAPQEEFYRTPQKKDVSRRSRRRLDQYYPFVSTQPPQGANRITDTTLRMATCVGRTRTRPPLLVRNSVMPTNKQMNCTHAVQPVDCRFLLLASIYSPVLQSPAQ